MRGITDCVLDGGTLMQRLYWNYPATYRYITGQYCSFSTRRYGQNTCLAFDGYKLSTKDMNT